MDNLKPKQIAVALAVKEIFQTVLSNGIGQPIRLFSLVKSTKLLEIPSLDNQIKDNLKNAIEFIPEHLSSIEQENIPQIQVDQLLGQIKWDSQVDGCAIYMEQNAVDQSCCENAPENEEEKLQYFKNHESYTKICVCAGVSKDGTSWTIIKSIPDIQADECEQIEIDFEESNSGVNILPELTQALLTTFE